MSAHRYLSEPEAWREIARRIAEGEWGGNSGLCGVRAMLWHDGLISGETSDAMSERTWGHIDVMEDSWYGIYAFPPGDADVRVLAALFLALEAESEAP